MLDISADFPGGNIILDSIEGDTIRLRQDRRDSSEWWFYWAFRIRGAAGRTLRFVFGDGDVLTTEGPCYSRDGANWGWLGAGCANGTSFAHAFAADEDEAWFALAFPYTERDLRGFLSKHPAIRCDTLALSEHGRAIERLTIPASEPVGAVLLTARMHACECLASFVLEGILAFWSSDSIEAGRLRRSLDLVAIPFTDKDGVERGDQGKLRAPHDHNRDFTASPIYVASAAIMRMTTADPGRWRAALDLHCPWIRNSDNEKIFLVGGPEPHATIQRRFASAIEAQQGSPLPFHASDLFPIGTGWNQGKAATFIRHMRDRTGCSLATTLEFPYARAYTVPVTPDAARSFGKSLALALALHLLPEPAVS